MTTLTMSLRERWTRRFIGGLCAGALVVQMGCYTFLPFQTTMPAVGNRIGLVLNDRGRFLLADRMGSAVDKIDGLLVSSDSAAITFEVYRTLDLRGGSATWAGERVQVPREGVAGYQERKFSKVRTGLLLGTVVGVIAGVMLTTNFNLFGGYSHQETSGGPSGETR